MFYLTELRRVGRVSIYSSLLFRLLDTKVHFDHVGCIYPTVSAVRKLPRVVFIHERYVKLKQYPSDFIYLRYVTLYMCVG